MSYVVNNTVKYQQIVRTGEFAPPWHAISGASPDEWVREWAAAFANAKMRDRDDLVTVGNNIVAGRDMGMDWTDAHTRQIRVMLSEAGELWTRLAWTAR